MVQAAAFGQLPLLDQGGQPQPQPQQGADFFFNFKFSYTYMMCFLPTISGRQIVLILLVVVIGALHSSRPSRVRKPFSVTF